MPLGTIILSLRGALTGPCRNRDLSLSRPPSALSRALHPCPRVCLVQKQPKAMVSVDELPRKFAFICQHQSLWLRMGSLPHS